MVITWESPPKTVAREYGISRDMQDELALLSQQKAVAAIHSGAFDAEIVPVSVHVA